MIDGSYNATIHKNQLLVSSEPITISGTGGGSTPAAFQATPASTEAATPAPEGQAGRTQSVQSTKTLTVTYEPVAKPLSRIGERDDGFLNADKILIAHPSDSRMEPWGPLNFTIATDKDSIVPVAMFRAVNGPITDFKLTKEQKLERIVLSSLVLLPPRTTVAVTDCEQIQRAKIPSMLL